QSKMNLVADGIIGVAIGDALGLPYHFKDRGFLCENPVLGMNDWPGKGLGMGFYSDDTSMTLCLLDSLTRYQKINYKDICNNLVLWLGNGKFTPAGYSFGFGQTTLKAIQNFILGTEPTSCGSKDEFANGNGSLIRILPLIFYLYPRYGEHLFRDSKCAKTIADTSSLTHAHERTIIAVSIYLSIAAKIITKRLEKGGPLIKSQLSRAIEEGSLETISYFSTQKSFSGQMGYFDKFLMNPKSKKINLLSFKNKEIRSSAYVVDTLEASIWCLLKAKTFKDAVLLAVNLGGDTDSCGSVTGGLAGLAYGKERIPKTWINTLMDHRSIMNACMKYNNKFARNIEKRQQKLLASEIGTAFLNAIVN
ncbi:MAG: ADP-ribosylglycohydrolase family protein, partial [Firmicutes bacterium]|nr:ADP-ribosylglycohydrolase family protein [Bacillota bacterium]